MHFRVFLKVKIQNGGIFWVAKISNIFCGLEISNIFWGERKMLGPSLRMQKKLDPLG